MSTSQRNPPPEVVRAYAEFVIKTGWMESPLTLNDAWGNIVQVAGTHLVPATPEVIEQQQQILAQLDTNGGAIDGEVIEADTQ